MTAGLCVGYYSLKYVSFRLRMQSAISTDWRPEAMSSVGRIPERTQSKKDRKSTRLNSSHIL